MSVIHRTAGFGFCLLTILMLQACATPSALQIARDQFRQGSATEALHSLTNADVSNRDLLLLYLDKGLVSQASGDYADSIDAFNRALEIVEELNYVSVRDQTTSIVSNDWAARYGGEISEKLWIHTFQMLNFLLLNAPESAAVEARRAVALFEDHGDILKQDVFTRSLMALSFESAGQLNSARVEYKKLVEDFDEPRPPLLDRTRSELVFIVASGFIDPKLPGDLFIDYDTRISFPYYAESFHQPPEVRVRVGESVGDYLRTDTPLVAISQRALAKRGKKLAARQALRLAAKHNIANSIEDKDPLVGALARIALMVIEQADTRSWETLPAYLTLIRVPVEPGEQSVTLDILVKDPSATFVESRRVFDIDLSPGQRLYKLIRPGVASL